MNKLKELWQYPVFRWCVYQTPLLVFGLMLKMGYFYAHDWDAGRHPNSTGDDYHWNNTDFADFAIPMWILILALPAVWVWRKPIFGFLNKKAEE
jgi:hypothetical protein